MCSLMLPMHLSSAFNFVILARWQINAESKQRSLLSHPSSKKKLKLSLELKGDVNMQTCRWLHKKRSGSVKCSWPRRLKVREVLMAKKECDYFCWWNLHCFGRRSSTRRSCPSSGGGWRTWTARSRSSWRSWGHWCRISGTPRPCQTSDGHRPSYSSVSQARTSSGF